MNDVKINTVDLGARQSTGAAASVPRSNSDKQAQGVSSGDFEITPAQVASVNKQARETSVAKAADTREQVREAVTRLNDYVQTVQRNLLFKLDDQSGKVIITVIDKTTSEVIRQIPDDVALRLARDLQQEEPLSLFNAKV